MSPTGGDGDDERPDDEEHAFAEAMRGARPLARGHERVVGAPPASSSRSSSRVGRVAPSTSPFIVEQSGQSITGRVRDCAAKQARELRGGSHPIDARVDLHGRAHEGAVRELERFVAGAGARGARCLLVIHGRGRGSDAGGPVLRPAVWDWLASAAAADAGVIAFASARPADGGDGATLVLLRRPARR